MADSTDMLGRRADVAVDQSWHTRLIAVLPQNDRQDLAPAVGRASDRRRSRWVWRIRRRVLIHFTAMVQRSVGQAVGGQSRLLQTWLLQRYVFLSSVPPSRCRIIASRFLTKSDGGLSRLQMMMRSGVWLDKVEPHRDEQRCLLRSHTICISTVYRTLPLEKVSVGRCPAGSHDCVYLASPSIIRASASCRLNPLSTTWCRLSHAVPASLSQPVHSFCIGRATLPPLTRPVHAGSRQLQDVEYAARLSLRVLNNATIHLHLFCINNSSMSFHRLCWRKRVKQLRKRNSHVFEFLKTQENVKHESQTTYKVRLLISQLTREMILLQKGKIKNNFCINFGLNSLRIH